MPLSLGGDSLIKFPTQLQYLLFFNTCTVHLLLFCTALFCNVTNKCTIVHLLVTVQNNKRSLTICETIVHLLVIVQTNGRSMIICEIMVHLLVTVQNNRRSMTICEIMVHLLVTTQNNAVLTVNTILIFKVSTKTRGARHRLDMYFPRDRQPTWTKYFCCV